MKKYFLLSLTAIFATIVWAYAGQRDMDASNMPFISHRGPGAFDNALAQNTPYEPVKILRMEIEKATGEKLDFYKGWDKDGEAHITVITPVEYWEILKPYLSVKEIDDIALKNNLQKAKLKVLGIGTGVLGIDGKEEKTYFLIVDAPGLIKVRNAIYKEFVKRGGDKNAFDPKDFYPHITIGYTKRDLHIQDGVKKDMETSHDRNLDYLLQKI